MIVGCFVLDLYCDAPSCGRGTGKEYLGHSYAQFCGNTAGAARAAARREGWRLDLRAETAACPGCAGRGSAAGGSDA